MSSQKRRGLIIYAVILIICYNCNISQEPAKETLSAESTLAQLDSLLIQLDKLNTHDCQKMDNAVTLNEKMRRIVENIQSVNEFGRLMEVYPKKPHKINFTFSDDKQIGVFSWDSKLTCLGHSIKNIALFKSKNSVVATSLYGEALNYNHITSSQEDTQKTIYLFHGNANSEKPIVNAYTITDKHLTAYRMPSAEEEYASSQKIR